jgi:hypothetical protein
MFIMRYFKVIIIFVNNTADTRYAAKENAREVLSRACIISG